MPLPITILMMAAKLAKDERTQRAAKAVFDVGSDAWRKRQLGKAPPPDAPEPPRRAAGFIARKRKFRSGQSGDLIRFRYEDEHGLSAMRTVGNWVSDGKLLTGYCLNRKAECEFTVGRIEGWHDISV